jgi:hypothetical protein
MALPDQSFWMGRIPLPKRDIQKLYSGFPSFADAEQERRTRIATLERGNCRADAQLAKQLSEARLWAHTACCPVLCLHFQYWFVGAALTIHRAIALRGEGYSLSEPDDAVDVGMLHTLDWERLDARMRIRVAQIAGEEAVADGMAVVNYDQKRKKWQPHYHMVIYDGSACTKPGGIYYWPERPGWRRTDRTSLRPLARWFGQMSLVAFGADTRTRQGRLNDRLSREYFRYLADRTPTSFIFGINCDLVNQRFTKPSLKRDEADDEDDYLGLDSGPSWPLPRRKISF